ncbi:MAG: hypothetical protein WDN28_17095 [Chthoniobacter sp.]
MLVAHPAAGENGYLKIGASEPAVLHRGIYMAPQPRDNDDRARMSKVFPALLAVTAAAALAVLETRALAQTVTEPSASIPRHH